MSDKDDENGGGEADPSRAEGQGRPAPRPEPARQLFGQRSGASPWEAASERPRPGQDREFGTPVSRPATGPRQPTSAPYPRDAQYAPRPKEGPRPAPATSAIFSEVDDEGELTKLHPNYKLMMRVGAVFLGLVIIIAGVIVDAALQAEGVAVPFGTASIPALVVALFLIIRIPNARYNARGYQISRDRLRVVRGILWHSDTVVPFGRVQHIDVDQGPIERALGIATMTLHTAGSHNASVSLPGLGHGLAVEMREEIRAHIKRETM
jgi:membrane protein YdbS with pleckstrin-like domain